MISARPHSSSSCHVYSDSEESDDDGSTTLDVGLAETGRRRPANEDAKDAAAFGMEERKSSRPRVRERIVEVLRKTSGNFAGYCIDDVTQAETGTVSQVVFAQACLSGNLRAANHILYLCSTEQRKSLACWRNHLGQTLLHRFAPRKAFSREIVLRIAQLGCNVNRKDLQGWTALHYAALYKNTTYAQVLIELGADPDLKDSPPQALSFKDTVDEADELFRYREQGKLARSALEWAQVRGDVVVEKGILETLAIRMVHPIALDSLHSPVFVQWAHACTSPDFELFVVIEADKRRIKLADKLQTDSWTWEVVPSQAEQVANRLFRFEIVHRVAHRIRGVSNVFKLA